ncbi:cytochrome C [Novosphingobium sp. FKTRR1]|uniref:c-type cytochrome n=1 Tax=unclassified Novosphingobium TaxID=2644732 RepID=UPI001CF02C24|nr:cytochrome C [Novosphingobium sp. FKTRR1]
MLKSGRVVLALAIVAAAGLGGWRIDVRAQQSAPVFSASPDPHAAPRPLMVDPEQARADYVENCAGCHGLHGSTVPAKLPELAGRVGWFMCTPEARAYLIRLPNVANSRITDNAQLADMMNYVIFELGKGSVKPGTPPFTAEEVAYERKFALSDRSLSDERLRLAKQVVQRCHAPDSIKLLYPGETAK